MQASRTVAPVVKKGMKMASKANSRRRRLRVAALLLVAGLVAGPLSTHVYWMLGGTWGLYDRSGGPDEVASTGVRIVAAIVVVLVVGAVFVVLARAGLWPQALVPDSVIRFLAWALAAVFVLETLAAFTWSRGTPQWWLYGPASLVLSVLALVVASSGGAWPIRRRHRTLPSH